MNLTGATITSLMSLQQAVRQVLVDTATYWSFSGEAVILVLLQVGGLGIMTGATLLGLLLGQRLGLTQRRILQAENRSLTPADVRRVMWVGLIVTLLIEALVAIALTFPLHLTYGQPWGMAAWSGLFHSVTAFTNAGFSLHSDSLTQFALDPLVLVTIMVAVVVGGLNFPVIHELREEWRQPGFWSIHARLTLLGSAILLAFAAFEWTKEATLGALPPSGRLLNAMFHSVMTRSGGLNTFATGELNFESLLISSLLMFIRGGSAGMAGGIKVTTLLLLGFVVWAEVKGHADTSAFRRRISPEVQRQALAVALIATAVVSMATLALLAMTDFSLDQVLFEVISAAATVGMSTGITADLPPAGHTILILLMYIGRVGTVTAATALALHPPQQVFRYPEERPIVG